MNDETPIQVETQADIGLSPDRVVKRWMLELQLAEKREREWRKNASHLLKRYRQKDTKRHSFNILWSNTDTILPAVYNSRPKPDVRRRFKDADPLGKAVADVLGRSLEYSLETYDFNNVVSECVLDMLLPGRGIARVRYVPNLRQLPADESAEPQSLDTGEGDQDTEVLETLDWEQVQAEHVQWDDYREGPGKTWDEVPWVGYRHRMTRAELVRKFKDIGEKVNLSASEDDEVEKHADDRIKELFKTAEVWEIWDKDSREVIFVSEGYKQGPLATTKDPLRLENFFPQPRPLRAVQDSSSNVPLPISEYYKEQALELDSITMRINRLIKGLKFRGIYDSTLSELSELMRGEDNDLIPADNVAALLERGGLEKAIWFMPIETAALVLKELYEQREAVKQIIYEITGISDIMRGATDAQETATAQAIKANMGSIRVRRMQDEVARYVRDLLKLKAEIIAERFQPETLMAMTGLQYPTAAQKAQAQQAIQAAQQQPGMPQAAAPQVDPSILQSPAWENIIGCLRNDAMRTFKVDIETDSTVALTIQDDMAGLHEVISGVVEIFQGFAPAVMSGTLPIEAVKEIVLAVVRRARMGNAVEDALEKMKQPAPPPDPNAGKIQAQQELEQFKAHLADQQAQRELQYDRERANIEAKLDQQRQAFQAQQVAHQNALEAQRNQLQAENEAKLEQLRIASDERLRAMEQNVEILIARINNATKIEVAEIAAGSTLQAAQISAAKQGDDDAGV